jgi:hypothetical protein
VSVLDEAFGILWRGEEALGALHGVVKGSELRRSEEVKKEVSIISNATQS